MRRFLLSGLLLVFTVPASRADVVVTYNFSGVQTTYGSTLVGTMTLDKTTGTFTGIDATYTTPLNGGQVNTFDTATTPGDVSNQTPNFFGDGYVIFVDSDQGSTNVVGGSQLALLLPYDFLPGYPGSLICADNYSCNNVISTFYTYSPTANNNSTTDYFCTGGLGAAATAGICTGGTQPVITQAPAATPEPSSLMLLGTGITGLAGLVRRRFRR